MKAQQLELFCDEARETEKPVEIDQKQAVTIDPSQPWTAPHIRNPAAYQKIVERNRKLTAAKNN